MSNGWIKLHRKTLDNPIVMKDTDHLAVWMWLLLNATHSDHDTIYEGERLTLKAGQFITGRKIISKELKINESKIQRILKTFEIEQQIEQQTNPRCRLISILRWSDYQLDEQQSEQQLNNKRTLNNKVKKINNNIYVQEFEKLWSLVPKKVNKKKSYQKYILAVKKKDHQTIYTAFKNQVLNNWKETDAQYTPALNVWLNGERWNDDIIKSSEKPFKQKKQFRKTPSGMYRGYCSKCGDTMFLEHKELNFSSVCCGVEFVPEKPKKYNGKDYTNETLNQIMEGSL
tara:strand:- start:8472 stop:9326 length:855 start_codon:yes stop_codon:yes gene_type:complete